MKMIKGTIERIKRSYFTYLREAKGLSEQSIDAIAAAIDGFEPFTNRADFKSFKPQQAIEFNAHLAGSKNGRMKEGSNKAKIFSTFNVLEALMQGLSREPGYKSSVAFKDAEYSTLSRGDAAIAKAEAEVADLKSIANDVAAKKAQLTSRPNR